MEVIITKKLKSDNGVEFSFNSNICFNLCRNNKKYECVGVITEISEEYFLIRDVEIDGMRLYDDLSIKYSEVENGQIACCDDGWR